MALNALLALILNALTGVAVSFFKIRKFVSVELHHFILMADIFGGNLL